MLKLSDALIVLEVSGLIVGLVLLMILLVPWVAPLVERYWHWADQKARR